MTVDTDWQPGAKVTLALTGQWRLTGAVLTAERPCRLSYTLDDPRLTVGVRHLGATRHERWDDHPPQRRRALAVRG
jgi:hypothetical protein